MYEDDVPLVHPTQFGDLLEPHEAAEPILSRPVRNALLEWLTEIWSEKELEDAGLKPRHRALFSGKPGTGKTTLAHHLAARLGLPLLVVRPERLIAKYLGETGRNIGMLFDLARRAKPPIILFMDEFDAIGHKRIDTDQSATQERNAWVNTLLQRIEQHRGYIIGATNFADRIDAAVWRRFDVHITVDLPGPFERERILARYLEPWGLPKPALKALADSFDTASPALMRQFAEGLKRNLVIGPKVKWDMRREPTIERLLAATQPHPDLGKPRLWSLGARDAAIAALPWPMPLAKDVVEDALPAAEADDKVVALPRRA